MQHFFFFIIAPLRGGARCAALLLGLGAAGPAAWGQNYFTPATITPTGANSVPRSVAVADVNRDGNPDALTANSASNTLGVLLGNGVGGFALQTNTPSTGVNSTPRSVAVADINGDGRPDVLTANSASNTLGVLLGDGAGGFALQANAPSTGVNSGPVSVTVADVNSDGRPDALTINGTNSTLGVLLGDGTGSFALQTNAPSTGAYGAPQSIALADVNSDGRLDVLTVNYTSSTLGVLLGNGAGGFALQSNAPSTGTNSYPSSVAVADVNGDGRPDALTANSASSTVGVLLGDGTGGFALQANAPSAGAFRNPQSVALADINGDGRPDALTANINGSTLGVLLGDGTGGFALQAGMPSTGANSGPVSLAVADVNGDGRPDALTVNITSSTLGVLLNNGTYTPLTSISPLIITADLTISPNPAHEAFTVQLPAGLAPGPAELLNTLGQVVRRPAVGAAAGAGFAVETRGLPAGVYTLRLWAGGAVRARRVVVE